MLKSRRALLVVGAIAEKLLLEWFAHEFPSSIAAEYLWGDAISDVPGIVGSVEVVLGGESDDVGRRKEKSMKKFSSELPSTPESSRQHAVSAIPKRSSTPEAPSIAANERRNPSVLANPLRTSVTDRESQANPALVRDV
eukprot:2680282-Rhodomonas_salina.2